jgi:hypothetical protein
MRADGGQASSSALALVLEPGILNHQIDSCACRLA